MIVIPLSPIQGVHLPAEPAPTSDAPTAASTSGLRSRSSSIAADDRSRSGTPSQSSSRRSTPRTNSAAYARARQPQPSPPAPSIDPTTGVELDTRHQDPRALRYDVPVDVPIPAFGKQTKDINRDLGRLYEAVASARRIAVICGAGVSVSSPANIPDFRSANGLFRKLKERHPTAGLSSGKDLFDARLFSSESTSALFYTMIAELKRLADEARPTIFHRFLKRLDEEGRLQRVYTQNIDGLEQKAGLTFGLGETGDSTSTVRALGKRKRQSAGNSWSRSKSDSHLLASKRAQEEPDGVPMFPRTIPLHGTLQTLTCALCSHKVTLGDTTQLDAAVPPRSTTEPTTWFTPRETLEALELLKEGEAVPCPKCTEIDENRRAVSLRSRGVGRMKTDVVLYGGQNEGAERVGECLQRDILGLRDPFEPPVPESIGEIRARERKEKKEEEKRQKEEEKAQAAAVAEEDEKQQATDAALVDAALGRVAAEAAETSICDISMDRDYILSRAFEDDDEPQEPQPQQQPKTEDEEEEGQKPEGLVPIAEDATVVKFATPPKPERPKRASRPARLKPLPPDLLIVAGTSLKVPGTKRIVREFAKACHARDARIYYSDSDDDEEDSNEDQPKGKGRRRSRSRSSSAEKEEAGDDNKKAGGEGSEGEDEEEDDPNAPIRTILLNYDFPVPSREWEDVFDVWVQGDLQRAALGVFPPRDVDDEADDWQRTVETIRSQYSWQTLKTALEEQRTLSKKKGRKSVAKDEEAPNKGFAGRASGGGSRWARSQSELVVKRRRPSEIEEQPVKPTVSKARGISRTSSKKGSAASASDASCKSEGAGKGKGGVGQKGAQVTTTTTTTTAADAASKRGAGTGHGRSRSRRGAAGSERKQLVSVVVMSSVAPPTPPPSTPSAESTPEPDYGGGGDVIIAAAAAVTSSPRRRAATTKQMQLKGRLGPGVKASIAAAAANRVKAAAGDAKPATTTVRTRSRSASKLEEAQ
ncbi:hypothetical protein ACQY0O_002498 [Thecaphora frezii]